MIYSLTLNWNSNNMLDKMLSGLLPNLERCNSDFSIFIRDNGSSDESFKNAKNLKNTTVFNINHNRGSFSEGVNFLFDKTNAKDDDVLLLLNNDVEFLDDVSIKKMLQTLEYHNASIVGARLMYAGNQKISHNGVIFCRKHGNMPWHFREGQKPNIHDRKTRKFQAVTAACMMVKAGAFIKAGKLDQNLRWAFEDVSLNLEVCLNQKGLVLCCGDTNIIHGTSVSLNKNPVHKMYMSKNVHYFKKKWYGKYELDHEKYIKNNNYNVVELV